MTQIEHENDHVNDVDPMTDAQVAHRDRIMEWLRLTDEQQIAALAHVRSDTREQAAASPSAVGEWRVLSVNALLAGFRAYVRAHPHINSPLRIAITERIDAIIAALSSQAPKPASAGDVRVVSQAVLQAAYEHVPTCQGGHTSEFVSGWSSCLEYLARTTAAEADSAKEQRKYRCAICRSAIVYHEGESCDSCCPPAADRLAPIEARGAVTDAEVEAACSAIVCEGENVQFYLAEGADCGEDSATRAMVHEIVRTIIAAALRARESAPAVEK